DRWLALLLVKESWARWTLDCVNAPRLRATLSKPIASWVRQRSAKQSCGTQKSTKLLILLVGAAGFEPAAPCSQSRGSGSNGIAEDLLTLAASYVPQSIVVALKIYLGIERYFGHLNRSDHTPFWNAGIPSIMWTDTSEFRNPHYHLASDKPGTLDYD